MKFYSVNLALPQPVDSARVVPVKVIMPVWCNKTKCKTFFDYRVVVLALLTAVLSQAGNAQDQRVDVLIAYYTMTGTTQKLARIVANGADEVDGVNVALKPIESVTIDDLREAEGVILGSPTYYGNMAGPMKSFIDSLGLEHGSPFLGGKVGGAFATGGGSAGGKEHVIISLLLAMINTGMMVAGPTYGDAQNGYALPGAAAIDTGIADEFSTTEIEDARRLGRRIAEIARSLSN